MIEAPEDLLLFAPVSASQAQSGCQEPTLGAAISGSCSASNSDAPSISTLSHSLQFGGLKEIAPLKAQGQCSRQDWSRHQILRELGCLFLSLLRQTSEHIFPCRIADNLLPEHAIDLMHDDELARLYFMEESNNGVQVNYLPFTYRFYDSFVRSRIEHISFSIKVFRFLRGEV
jgi:hypothetical protein